MTEESMRLMVSSTYRLIPAPRPVPCRLQSHVEAWTLRMTAHPLRCDGEYHGQRGVFASLGRRRA